MAERLDQGRELSRSPLYVSNKNETVRMFESDFMEFFSRVHPVTPLVLYVPVVCYMLYNSVWQRQLSIAAVTALFLLGILLWTLIEYLIHRYVFHYQPKTRWGKRLRCCSPRVLAWLRFAFFLKPDSRRAVATCH